ncbi:Uncharacterized protein TCM_001372 [Theobroma cacao]|uniref:Uncharacterized protein n=1 Tax=Theobroma cacao TaxID=3641 RepID=A0A061DR30_THECC|nr:Uncharacterized protein TCM_001372 [Theobroma cacao]
MMERKGERYDWQGADAPCQAPLSPARREKFASGRLVELAPGCPGTRQYWSAPSKAQKSGGVKAWECLLPVGGVFAAGRRREIWAGLPSVGGATAWLFAAGERSSSWSVSRRWVMI